MAVSDQLKALVDQMPKPDGRGMYTENIDKEKIEKAIAAIYKGGRANVQGLVEMLGEPGWERIQATKNCMVLAEKLAAADRQSESQKIYKHLRDTRKDSSERHIRDAAEAALA